MEDVLSRHDRLKDLIGQRIGILAGFVPRVQLYDPSHEAWATLLSGWREASLSLPLHLGATPMTLQSQIEHIKVWL